MKKTLLLLGLLSFAVLQLTAQCDAPSYVQATPRWDQVKLTWESPLLNYTPTDVISYGGDVSIGVGLGDYTFTAAIRLTPDSLIRVSGKYLSHVKFTLWQNTISTLTIKVWQGGSYDSINDIFYEGTLVSSTPVDVSTLVAGENTVTLNTPVLVNSNQEIWIGYEVLTSAGSNGFPAAATNTVYDNLNNLWYAGDWMTLATAGIEGFGWLISGWFVQSVPDISGFNVYRDTTKLNTVPITDHFYTDAVLAPQTQYCYRVESVCSSTTNSSAPICVATTATPTCGTPIGADTTPTTNLPFNSYYNYSYSQQIFTASEIGTQQGTIVSLGLPYMYATPQVFSNVQVYMANILKTTFNSTTDWIPGNDLTLVYDGPYSCNAADTFSTIAFNTPFEWDGVSNVVVAIVYNEGTFYENDPRFYCHTTTGSTSLYAYRDASPYSISTPTSGSLANIRNNILFCFGPQTTCYTPDHVIIHDYDISPTSAIVSWHPHSATDHQWEVVCVLSGNSINSGTPIIVSNSTCTLSNLIPNSDYDVYVRTVCSASESSNWAHLSFRTYCADHQTIPYVETFNNYGEGGEDTYPFCWGRKTNNTTTQYPYVSSYGQLILYSYENLYSLAVSQALNLSTYPAGTLALDFLVGITNESYGRLDVGVMTDPTNLGTFTLLKSYYPSDFPVVGEWMHEYITLPESYPSRIFLAFYAPAPVASTVNFVNVDEVRVDYVPTCSNPSNLTVLNVTGTASTLSWTPAQYGSTGYTLKYEAAGQAPRTVTTTDCQYMLTGLTPNTEYEVKLVSNCVGGSSDTISTVLTTANFVTCQQPNPTPLNLVDNTLDPTNTFQLPINTYYNYSYTQQIIPASQIQANAPVVITGIGFDYNYSSPLDQRNNVKIYLAHRASSTFASTSDWTPISEATLVYEGGLNCTQGWNVFNFDTYFTYNGNDNLVVIVDNNSGIYNTSSYVFRSRTGTTYQSLFYFSDVNNPNPAEPPTGTRSFVVSDMELFLCNQVAPISCPEPMVYTTGANDQSITVAWVSNGSENAWSLQYKPENSNNWITADSVSASPYTIRNLVSDVNYDIRLCALCSATESSEWAYTTAYTPCASVSIPYFENFENEVVNQTPSCWMIQNNTTNPTPVVNATFAASGSKSLFFNCPVTNNYAYGILPRFNNQVPMNNLQVKFKAFKTVNAHRIDVGIMTDPTDPSTFVLLGEFSPSVINNWEMGEIITNHYNGNGHYLAFRIPKWYSNSMYIDDVDIQENSTCPHVSNIYAADITATSATIRWTAGNEETQWAYLYGPNGTVDPAVDTPLYCNTNSLVLTGLIPNTLYTVHIQAYCDTADQSSWSQFTFRTSCGIMQHVPYTEDFDSYMGTTSTVDNVLPNCWSRINNGNTCTGFPTVYASGANTGANCLAFYTHSFSIFGDQYAILPEIDTAVLPINTLELTMSMAARSNNDPFQVDVGVMSDPDNPSTFTLVRTVTTTRTVYSNQLVCFDDYTGDGRYIVLRVKKPISNYNYGYIDDVVLSPVSDCAPVSNLKASNVAGTSALISWDPAHHGTISGYTLLYSVAGQNHWDTASSHITGAMYMLNNLIPNTDYEVKVITNCDSSYSIVVSQTFRTTCLAGGEITIGDGSEINDYIPSYSYYNYCYSQQVFTANEMGGANTFSSISFNMANWAQHRTLSIYLMHTTESTPSTWLPTANATLVFSGVPTLAQGWNSFIFQTPFVYDGVHNLAVIVIDETGSYNDGNSWFVHESPSGMGASLYTFSDYNHYTINSTPTTTTGGPSKYCNDVIFGGECNNQVSCIPPNFYVSNISTHSADIVWTNGGAESSWEMEYKKSSESTWTPVANLSNFTAHLTNLQSSTLYTVRMRSNCGATYSSYKTMDFMTECDVISTLPFQENFDFYGTSEHAYPPCWSKINNHSSDMPIISTYNYSAPGALYFLAGSPGTRNIAITPEFDTSIVMNSLRVTFMYAATSPNDKLVVGVMSDPEDVNTFVAVDTAYPASSAASSWIERDVYLNNYQGNGRYIAFKNEASTYAAFAYLDSLVIDVMPSCLKPRDLSAISNSSSVILSWTETGSATAWEIEYGAQGFTPGTGTTVAVTTNPYTIDNLSAATYDFYVRANCGNNDFSDWVGPIQATPGSYNLPTTGEYTLTMCGGYLYDNGGPDAHYDSDCDVTVVINPDMDGMMVHMTGTFELEDGYDKLIIYDGSDDSGTVLFNSDEDTTLNVTSTTGPLTLHFESDESIQYSGFAIQVTCEGGSTPESCEAPTDLTVYIPLNGAEAQLSWNQQGEPDNWTVNYRQASSGGWTTETATTSSYTLTNLASGVEYEAFVVANCGEQISEESNHVTFTLTGINNYLMSSSVLYPNPTTGKFRIENSELMIENVEVYDVYGKLIMTMKVGDNSVNIDLSGNASGVYFARVITEMGTETLRVIKN
ncbi:MAG: fibronectin type III domain-containing protein [Bacteroidales bacterium]|nr:fibronectin type III domain-containing protein [Bacteroidales bacterium]